MSKSRPMPESEPLTSEQVDQQEEGDLDVPYVSKQQWIATIRDRERRRGDWVEAGNVLSENCNEYSIEVFNLKQERDDLRRQLEEGGTAPDRGGEAMKVALLVVWFVCWIGSSGALLSHITTEFPTLHNYREYRKDLALSVVWSAPFFILSPFVTGFYVDGWCLTWEQCDRKVNHAH